MNGRLGDCIIRGDIGRVPCLFPIVLSTVRTVCSLCAVCVCSLLDQWINLTHYKWMVNKFCLQCLNRKNSIYWAYFFHPWYPLWGCLNNGVINPELQLWLVWHKPSYRGYGTSHCLSILFSLLAFATVYLASVSGCLTRGLCMLICVWVLHWSCVVDSYRLAL